ncbi:TBC1 domain family member 14-like [Cimex lectularius]|uniref:Rab-GAP TBC domain-containing protein n=1 Tax=Cimex lectularius TaxID=79782 RepID=A0A8I6S647_CIMLE|nr:TBC1 domain family member 14-like [Cimex lectularius]
MKTITSGKEHDVKYTAISNGPSQPQPQPRTEPCQEECDNLIKCDSQLASSFRDGKLHKRLRPGYYLQRVFLPKAKSQSVVLGKGTDAVQDKEPSDSEETENWFRTWPDCLEKKNDDKEKQSETKNPPVSLDSVLHDLPIAYSPVTKQIHLIDDCVKKNERLPRTDTGASSFSSTVSSLSDASPSTNGDQQQQADVAFDVSDNCSLISIGNCSIVSEDSDGDKPKRRGLSGFFSRGVFGWKGKGESEGWSLFGKLANGYNERSISSLSDERRSLGGDSGRGVQGSTGLIQLERPAWLPAKSKQEQQAHSDEHEKIISSARKKELKESKQRKKVLQSQLKAEDELASATRTWTQEILPNWSQMREQKKTQELWWQGIPPCVRGKLWRLAITNDLNITHGLYEICVSRALQRLKSAAGSTDSIDESSKKDADREASMELIQLDISRTFPHLCIFQKKGPYYDMLHSLLAAYVCYRPDVGYVQGMSFIAAVLILNMDAPDAFVCFANILNRPCHRAFYSLDQPLMEAYYAVYVDLLRENVPQLYKHLESCSLTPDLYLLDWIYTIFAKAMPLDLASRVWDVFLRDGEEFLFRTAIGVLKLFQKELLTMDFLSGSQYLTRLPEDLNPNVLFKSIGSIKMSVGKNNFKQILLSYTHHDV